MKVILGSASQSRQMLLKDWGYEFEVVTADIDEKAIRHHDPQQLVLAIAQAKMDAVLQKVNQPAIVITSDQVVACAGQILEKPADEGEARKFLQSYRNNSAQTVTAVVVANTKSGQRVAGVDVVNINFSDISDQVIEDLIASQKVYYWAGAFDIKDPLLEPYVLGYDGEWESVLGLPKKLTLDLINQV